VNRAREGWRRAQQSTDDFYLDSAALNLHGFYVGLERVFELIAATVESARDLVPGACGVVGLRRVSGTACRS